MLASARERVEIRGSDEALVLSASAMDYIHIMREGMFDE